MSWSAYTSARPTTLESSWSRSTTATTASVVPTATATKLMFTEL